MSAPLTPSNFCSPRRVVSVEYETPNVQFLPSPACLSASSTSWSSASRKAGRTPRRLLSTHANREDEAHEEFVDFISQLLDRSCFHLIQNVLFYLDTKDLNAVQLVCRKWRTAYLCDDKSHRRVGNYVDEMKLYVRTVGIENAPSPKVTCASKSISVPVQRPLSSSRSALSDMSNTTREQRRVKKPVKSSTVGTAAMTTLPGGSLESPSTTPRKPALLLDPGCRATKLVGLTPEDAVKKAKKISSAKKESRMRRLRC